MTTGSQESPTGGKDEEAIVEDQSKDNTLDSKPAENSSDEVYTLFTPFQRKLILLVTTLAAFFSPFSATTYLPALTPIQRELGITATEVNLSLTTYLIFQAIGPTISGELSDTLGRRPVFLLTFVVYIAACVGLALQTSLPALLVLRMLQSSGSSGTIAMGFGTIADITVSAERGTYMGVMTSFPLAAGALGPVIGGAIAESLGWRWIFWFLVIFGGATLVILAMFFPETNRQVVGNGSIRPPVWNRPLFEKLTSPALKSKPGLGSQTEVRKRSARDLIPNPFRSVVIIWNKDVTVILFVMSIYYADYYAIVGSLPQLFGDIYGYNELQVGLCYLSFGTGGIVGSLLMGKLIDHDFKVTAQKEGIEVDRKKLEDMAKFPIEKARLKSIWWIMGAAVAGTIAYGWALNARPSVAVPLVIHFVTGGTITSIMNVVSVLIVDLYPASPATATASANLCRCMLGAVATSVIDLMLTNFGIGWTFTFWGLMCAACFPILEMERRWGKEWRMARFEALLKNGAEDDVKTDKKPEEKA